MPKFPSCSACRPRSRAPYAIALCGRLPIGLREPLGASVTLLEATTPVKLPAKQCPRSRRVRGQMRGGQYFNGGSPGPEPRVRCLLAILRTAHPATVLSCSKGSRGLFVPLRVIGIFTDTTISPRPRLRQRPDHYTIRAGRNLPDKEFRYLRTVIVTAAVYRGFTSPLR